ncbi:MAG TPA: sigma factor G inhibitor Gin [Syntrophomonadaceae bacterium]|nr:sigma factor G inhibitor Gin [Syntrophomonadaceae bacterium]
MSKSLLTDTKEEAVLLPICAFCRNVPAKGIKGGYLINKSFICLDCEKKILDTTIGSPAYQEMLELIKGIIK